MDITFVELLVVIVGGIGAGIVTGLVGGSAALVITPLFVSILKMDPYVAISIALATDVFASGVSTITYTKLGYVDVKNAVLLVVSAAIGAIFGTVLSGLLDSSNLGAVSMWITLIIGLNFLLRAKVEKTREKSNSKLMQEHENLVKIVLGLVIGIVCGFIGAGGGMIILLVLLVVLGYDLKRAVGTSVFIMTFTALFGAVSHFYVMGEIPYVIFTVTGIFAIISAKISATFIASAELSFAKRVAGLMLIVMFFITYFTS